MTGIRYRASVGAAFAAGFWLGGGSRVFTAAFIAVWVVLEALWAVSDPVEPTQSRVPQFERWHAGVTTRLDSGHRLTRARRRRPPP